jgi:hypothetical protein
MYNCNTIKTSPETVVSCLLLDLPRSPLPHIKLQFWLMVMVDHHQMGIEVGPLRAASHHRWHQHYLHQPSISRLPQPRYVDVPLLPRAIYLQAGPVAARRPSGYSFPHAHLWRY